MMRTKSLFVKVIISVAILSLGIIIGKYLPLIKFEKPKIKQYEYLGKINTGSKIPIKPLPYNISNDGGVNRSGVVTNAATAYKISNAIFIRAFGKDKINYDKPFKIQLEDGYIWSIEAESQDSPFLSYHIAIDKRNGRIIHLIVKK